MTDERQNQQALWLDQTNTAKQLFVALDHGLSYPDMKGLEEPLSLLAQAAANPQVDGIIACPGLYRQAEKAGLNLSHITRLITVDFVASKKQDGREVFTHRETVITPQDAAAYAPHGFKMFFNMYDDPDLLLANIQDFSRFAAAGKRLGIAALAEVVFFGNLRFSQQETQAEELAKGCRMAMELGADVLKIPAISDKAAMAKIIRQVGLPTYILGGVPEDEDGFAKGVGELCSLPIHGLMLGRNIWQYGNMNDRINKLSAAVRG